ncbi:MAG: CehA/McbA family metallohydrolase, partial [Acidobacteria bacterium]|nr:CehA/McbA family metallohydrolase [Acidobacteriota bacterium]
RFNQIDAKAKEQYDEENKREVEFSKAGRGERRKTGDLTWFAGDLHSHSFYSDGRWSIEGILKSASAKDLDFVSIVDHNTFAHHQKMETAGAKFPEILAIRGEEVTTHGGHINVWGLPKNEWVDFRVTPNLEESAQKIANEAAKFGAIASINHPFMDCPGCGWTYGKWGNLSAVEIWNGKWDEQDQRALVEWDKLLLNDVKVTGIASSDSHQQPNEPSKYPLNLPIGEPTVFVAAREKTVEAILGGIKDHKVFSADNPRRWMMLTANETATIGDTIEVPYGEVVKFKFTLGNFENGSKFWLYANGQVAKEYLIYEQNYEGEYNIYAKQDGYVRLEVRNAKNEMLGFSNPIFFRVKYPDESPRASKDQK